jgi:predicted enzyme related to lactoylglutathione lyase
MDPTPDLRKIGWCDLTVRDAERIRDFYCAVVGWVASEVPMGGYSDYCLHPSESSAPVAGVCHARGLNADLPTQWLPYIAVPDLEASLERCLANGGSVMLGMRSIGRNARFCVIRDPAGALVALFSKVPSESASRPVGGPSSAALDPGPPLPDPPSSTEVPTPVLPK